MKRTNKPQPSRKFGKLLDQFNKALTIEEVKGVLDGVYASEDNEVLEFDHRRT